MGSSTHKNVQHISHLITNDKPENYDEFVDKSIQLVHLNHFTPRQHDSNCLKLKIGFVPAKRIQKPIEYTTQFYPLDAHLPLVNTSNPVFQKPTSLAQ
jgi:hypothetical protein